MSRTIFYGPKDVRAIEVRLYIKMEEKPLNAVVSLLNYLYSAVNIQLLKTISRNANKEQSIFNGSNIFGTMEIYSRHG